MYHAHPVLTAQRKRSLGLVNVDDVDRQLGQNASLDRDVDALVRRSLDRVVADDVDVEVEVEKSGSGAKHDARGTDARLQTAISETKSMAFWNWLYKTHNNDRVNLLGLENL